MTSAWRRHATSRARSGVSSVSRGFDMRSSTSPICVGRSTVRKGDCASWFRSMSVTASRAGSGVAFWIGAITTVALVAARDLPSQGRSHATKRATAAASATPRRRTGRRPRGTAMSTTAVAEAGRSAGSRASAARIAGARPAAAPRRARRRTASRRSAFRGRRRRTRRRRRPDRRCRSRAVRGPCSRRCRRGPRRRGGRPAAPSRRTVRPGRSR